MIGFSLVQFDMFFNARFSGARWTRWTSSLQSTPKLSFVEMEDERKMLRKTVPDERSDNAETSFAEFRRCSWHDQISTFRRTETGSTREIHRASLKAFCIIKVNARVTASETRSQGEISRPNSITLYWSQTGPSLVADLSQTC